jgi:hypothetical protein
MSVFSLLRMSCSGEIGLSPRAVNSRIICWCRQEVYAGGKSWAGTSRVRDGVL